MLDDAAWLALTAVLTAAGRAVDRAPAGRKRQRRRGARRRDHACCPPPRCLTGTLSLGTRIVDAVVDWATELVFNPLLWFGVGLAGLSVGAVRRVRRG